MKRASKYIESLSDEDDVGIQFDDLSDSDVSDEIIDANMSDYVGVRLIPCEGAFLQRVNRKIDPGMNAVTPTFIANKNDAFFLAPEDIILKLPAPVVVGNSAGKSCQFRFEFDFAKLHLAE